MVVECFTGFLPGFLCHFCASFERQVFLQKILGKMISANGVAMFLWDDTGDI